MSLDDVNRQHMEAMGLDPESLGKPAPRRCSSRWNMVTEQVAAEPGIQVQQCTQEEGHSGVHRSRWGYEWPNIEDTVLNPTFCAAIHHAPDGEVYRCEMPHGHDGNHAGFGLLWDNTFKQREGDQPLPIVNDHPDIQAAVIADIETRREVGIQRYGTALQPNNGRDMLLDAYEEALDLAIYLKGAIVERDLRRVAEAAQEPVEVAPDLSTWREVTAEEYVCAYRSWYSLFFTGDVENVEIDGVHIRRIINLRTGVRPPSLAYVGAYGEPGTTYYEEVLNA